MSTAVHFSSWVLSLAAPGHAWHQRLMHGRAPESWTKSTSDGVHVLSTDPARLQLDWITRELQGSYWAASIQRQTVDRCVAGAWCFGVYREAEGGAEEQVGFGRLITDWATFAYVCDVLIAADSRGRGLGKWLVETMVSHPDLQGLRLWLLGTADAHELYRPFGFTETPPGRFMARRG